jgi:hypothetical protein
LEKFTGLGPEGHMHPHPIFIVGWVQIFVFGIFQKSPEVMARIFDIYYPL